MPLKWRNYTDEYVEEQQQLLATAAREVAELVAMLQEHADQSSPTGTIAIEQRRFRERRDALLAKHKGTV
jgi:hypothetical protein